MQSKFHASLLSRRQYCLDEVSVVGPDILGRVFAFKLRLLNLLSEVVSAEFACQIATPFCLIRRIGVGGMEVIRRNWDFQPAKVTEKRSIRFDFLVTARLPELHFQRAISIVDPREYANAVMGESLLGAPQVFK